MLFTYTKNRFPSNEYYPMMIEDYEKNVVIDGTTYYLRLFDTAGQEEYDRLRKNYIHKHVGSFTYLSKEVYAN